MARRSRRSKPSGLPHLVVGLALGLAVAAGVYFSDLRSGAGVPTDVERSPATATPRSDDAGSRPPTESAARTTSGGGSNPSAAAASASGGGALPAGTAQPDTGAARRDADEAAQGAAAAAGNDDEPRFDFYEILPEYEVLLPEEVERVSPPAQPAVPVATPGSYVLQTGSFRSHADADRMKASLALLGIESRIQKAAIEDEEFHRVRIGPISNLDELNRIRAVLSQAGVEILMMKAD